jgi:HD-like signal output (HDOD) protein
MTKVEQQVKNLENKQHELAGDNWTKILELISDLPPIPAVANKAIQLAESPLVSTQKLNDVLATDTALTARILKIANSAMFARQKQITTLSQAIMTIGFKSLKGIIVAAAVKQINKTNSDYNKLVWNSSVASAIASSLIATNLKKRYREEVYILGLLRNIGQLAMANHKELQKKFPDVVTLVTAEGCNEVEAEEKVYGFTHPVVGSLLAKKWNFPDETCDILLSYRHVPENKKAAFEQEEKAAIIYMAELLCIRAKIPGTIMSHNPGCQENDEVCQIKVVEDNKILERIANFLELAPADKIDEEIENMAKELSERYYNDCQMYL